MSTIFRIYWDGDVYDELLADVSRHNQPYLEKYNVGRLVIDGKQVYQYGYNVTCNGTKGTPCLTADIFGDWREEMIFYNNEDKQTLNVFSTSVASSARVPCLMYDHTYRMAITWQNAGYNQPPHLGYYLPDATAPRFTLDEQTMSEAGDSLFLTVHYVNCTGATISKVILPDGTSSSATSTGFKLTKDTRLCNLLINGKPADNGTWQFVLKATNPSNGIATTDTLSVAVNGVDGIETNFSTQTLNAQPSTLNYYDLSGRPLNLGRLTLQEITTQPAGTPDRKSANRTLPKGIYIMDGRKVVVR